MRTTFCNKSFLFISQILFLSFLLEIHLGCFVVLSIELYLNYWQTSECCGCMTSWFLFISIVTSLGLCLEQAVASFIPKTPFLYYLSCCYLFLSSSFREVVTILMVSDFISTAIDTVTPKKAKIPLGK